MITKERLKSFFEDTSEDVVDSYVDPLNKATSHFNINNTNRIAMFIAQVGYESSGLTRTQENLNYRADRLVQEFPKYFNSGNAERYAYDPEKIANRVYANRMGNGSEQSGDGFKFHGRGLIQLTGRENYTNFAKKIGMNVDSIVDYVSTPEGAAMSAGWFWNERDLNKLADERNVVAVTKRINGGINGLAQRKKLFEEALKTFA